MNNKRMIMKRKWKLQTADYIMFFVLLAVMLFMAYMQCSCSMITPAQQTQAKDAVIKAVENPDNQKMVIDKTKEILK